MKKLLMMLTAFVLLIALAACGATCKVDGCDDKVYESGYCKYHYTTNAIKEGIDQATKEFYDELDTATDGLFDGLFGN